MAVAGAVLILAGCDTVVGGIIATADHVDATKRQSRMKAVSVESQGRYAAMAKAGDPKGMYFAAYVHAAKHRDDPGMDAVTVMQMYEQAMAKGSNDAKALLGALLICGNTGLAWTNACFPDAGLPQAARDPKRGMELLQQAANNSCSVTAPLQGYGRCREREENLPGKVYLYYRDGKGGIPKDPVQRAYWDARSEVCQAEVDAINRQRGCGNDQILVDP